MLRIIIPLTVGQLVLSECPPVETTQEPIQNSIRKLMWPMLMIAIGLAWQVASIAAKKTGGLTVDFAFTVLVALMMWWLRVQFCKDDPQTAKYILLIVAAVTGFVTYIAGTHNPLGSMLLLPVLVWLLLAERLQIPNFRLQLPSISLPSIKIVKKSAEPTHTLKAKG
jgi:tryptophan-rich sensory protein